MGSVWKREKKDAFVSLILALVLGIMLLASGEFVGSKLALQNTETGRLPIERARGIVLSTDASNVEQIDTFVRQQMQRHGLPGLALALVEGDQVIFVKGYGQADQTGRPITPQTPFILASVSKPITAAAVMQLVESGHVQLDAPVQRYLPEFRVADPVASGQITVRHLLLHTSGIPNTACDARANAETLAEYVAELRTVELASPVGARYNYCSGNYNLLGRIIEVVSGQSYGEYIQGNIFNPLNMEHSFVSEQEAQQAGLAEGYQWFYGLPISIQHRYNPSQLPSGYILSSAEDMSHFLVSQLNQGNYANNTLLSASSVAAMQAQGVERGNGGGYGFGWVVAPVGGVDAVWHDGVNVNYHSLLLMQPETRRGVVILMNSFNIVAYGSAYKEIEEGVVRLLADLEPAPASNWSFGAIYLVIDAILAGVLAIAAFPLFRLRRWYSWLQERQQTGRLPLVRVSLRSAWEIGFALAFLVFIRLAVVTAIFGGQSWFEVLGAFPDFVLWVWALALVVFITGVIRLKYILRTLRAGARASQDVAVDAPLVESL